MNQREEAKIAARITEESAAVAQSLAELDQLIDRLITVRRDMKEAMIRIEALQSTLVSD